MIGARNRFVDIMPTGLAVFFGLIIAVGCTQSLKTSTKTDQADQLHPNIVLILTDDQGWGDVGFNGNHAVDTPVLDALYRDSASFDRFYVSPVCSPTRASLLTGRHSLRTGVWSVTRGGEKMRTQEITLAEALKPAGYATGIFGKWHNGTQYPYDPIGQGFDDFFGFAEGHLTRYFNPVLVHNGQSVQTSGYVADTLTDQAIGFIETHKDQPFLAYLPFNTPHGPFEAPKAEFDKYKTRGQNDLDASIYAMMDNIDSNIGRVMDTLKRLGLDDNTIVVFLSDNGPAFPHGNTRYNGNMRGHKGSVDEGGVRLPLLIHWPEKIKPGIRLTQPAQHIDIFPTLLELTGVMAANAPAQGNKIDGWSLAPLLLGEPAGDKWSTRRLYTHHFRNTRRPDQQPILPSPGAVRTGSWLATIDRDAQWKLYNLDKDPEQKTDIAAENKALLNTLQKDYSAFFKDATSNGFENLPVELGHSRFANTLLPAHEGLLFGDGFDYAFKAGWSHDWIETTGAKSGRVKWPINFVRKGRYEIYIAYGAPTNVPPGGFSLEIGGLTTPSPALAAYSPVEIPGARRYYTDEAPDFHWKEHRIAIIDAPMDAAEIVLHQDAALPLKALQIKHVRIVRLDD